MRGGGASACVDCVQVLALGQQPWPSGSQHGAAAITFPDSGGGSRGLLRSQWLGCSSPFSGAVLARRTAGTVGNGLCHLASARHGSRRTGDVAGTPCASRRLGLRPDHRVALSSCGDRSVDADQVCDHRRIGSADRSGSDLRGGAQRRVNVQPWQRPSARGSGSRAALGCRHTRHAPHPPLRRGR